MGDIQEGFKNAEMIVEDEVEIGGQLHFYMETHRCLVVPRDSGELEIFAGAQNPTSAQVQSLSSVITFCKKKKQYLMTNINKIIKFIIHILKLSSTVSFQRDIIDALGLPQHKVTCRTKRLGGAFGGKECQGNQFAVIACAAAKKYPFI